ncbi:MAG: hypothetical protein JO356_04020 [Acidobacteria bacterium]|nr:hypothetical protein [Acidobacteriota bacterium]
MPSTEEERDVVRQQLECILASSAFRHSKRYASVLRYIVEQSLDGTAGRLKERTIGIEVFGRTPDYDTATDHAVRSAVAEVRKRLAQYYQEEANGSRLRIEIQPGSYVPLYRWISDHAALEAPESSRAIELQPAATPQLAEPSSARHWSWLWVFVCAATAVALLVVAASFLRAEDPIESFWGPVLSARGSVLLCVGNLQGGYQSDGDTLNPRLSTSLRDFHQAASEIIHVDDAVTLARIAGLIAARGRSYQVVSQSDATFTDLQNGPAVLIGLMNNDWTERLVKNLRFTVEHPARNTVIIRDHNNPGSSLWSLDFGTPYLEVTKDYALVLRVADPKTDQMVVTVAGISVFGTLAAGEFLTSAQEIKKLAAIAPRGWQRKNLELVLALDVIRGRPGHAMIVASHFW